MTETSENTPKKRGRPKKSYIEADKTPNGVHDTDGVLNSPKDSKKGADGSQQNNRLKEQKKNKQKSSQSTSLDKFIENKPPKLARKSPRESSDSSSSAVVTKRDVQGKIRKKYKKSQIDKSTDEYYLNIYKKSIESGYTIPDSKKLSLAYPLVFLNKWTVNLDDKNQMSRIASLSTGFSFANTDSLAKIPSFYNLGSPVSSFDCSDDFIFIGLKQDTKPFNIFEKREGKGFVTVLDRDFKFVTKLKFLFGDVVQIKYEAGAIFVLFTNGLLIKILESSIKNLIQNAGELTADLEFNEIFDDFTVLNSSYAPKDLNEGLKIISFDVSGDNIVVTDGVRIISNEQSISSPTAVIDVLILSNYIYSLDLHGKVLKIKLSNFSDKEEAASNYSIFKLQKAGSDIVAISDDDYFVLTDPSDNEFFGFFNTKSDGKVLYSKKYKGRRNERSLFQLANTDQSVKIITDKNEFINKPSFIPRIIDFKNYILICTENGVLAKIYYI